MLKSALLLPGQGSQRAGMLAGLPGHPAIAATLEESSAFLGCDWRDFDGAEALSNTYNAQIALTIAGVACARALAAEGAVFDVVCGHSVGGFPAAVAAGSLGFKDALSLVGLRGRLMAEMHPTGYGMSAIVGLREPAVVRLVEEARRAGPLYVSNRNGEIQLTVSGADAALAEVARLALDAGARKAERLAVATPSHSPLVAEVAERLLEAVREVEFSAPKLAYVSARRARLIRDPVAIAQDLARNAAEPVLWRDAMRLIGELGVETAIETAPGAVLRDLAAEQLPDARVASLADTPLATVVHWTRRA
ncbi:acyltransferase domain-containing protein [Methylopila sp. M107]|uniref:ACP S-malonyltransferase n=1 Tax=Methylopila sp. M107 TaxID=1101190 RepID=UPI00036861CE|nr:acyltransferase domain-containing protein [Methylopila sp. M107]